jgi:uncharacterized protein YfkK (UPF0435 family)
MSNNTLPLVNENDDFFIILTVKLKVVNIGVVDDTKLVNVILFKLLDATHVVEEARPLQVQ